MSKAGQSDIRRLLIIGAMSRLNWLGRKSIKEGSWLDRIKGRKPRLLVAVALANKMARMIWAIATKKELYRDPDHRPHSLICSTAHLLPSPFIQPTRMKNSGQRRAAARPAWRSNSAISALTRLEDRMYPSKRS